MSHSKIKTLADAVDKTEKQYVVDLVAAHNGNLMLAAMSIYVYPGALRYWINKPTVNSDEKQTAAPSSRSA